MRGQTALIESHGKAEVAIIIGKVTEPCAVRTPCSGLRPAHRHARRRAAPQQRNLLRRQAIRRVAWLRRPAFETLRRESLTPLHTDTSCSPR